MERYIDNGTLFYVFEKNYPSMEIKDYDQRESVNNFSFTFEGQDLSDLLITKDETHLVIKARDSNETITFKHWDWDNLSENAWSGNLLVQNHDIFKALLRAAALDGEPVSAVIGTENSDMLTGGAEANVIEGLAGDDILRGLEGNDQIFGGSGNDIVYGGSGDDIIIGGYITAPVYAGRSNATNKENKVLYGEEGNDLIYGGLHGHNLIYGGQGNDKINGAMDDDILYGEGGNDNLRGNAGDDTIRGGAGDDVLNGGDGNDALYGGAGNDYMSTAGTGPFTTESDYHGGRGDDYMSGGKGNDTYEVFNRYASSSRVYRPSNSTGYDTIDDRGDANEVDTIIFHANLSDVLFSKKGDNLVLTADYSEIEVDKAEVEIIDFFSFPDFNKIEVFQFTDYTLTNPDFASYLNADSSASYSMSVFAPVDTQALI